MIFEINTITGLRYVELQRLHANPQWYYKARNQIILPHEAQLKVKQKAPKRTIDRLPSTFAYLFKLFIDGKHHQNVPLGTTTLLDGQLKQV